MASEQTTRWDRLRLGVAIYILATLTAAAFRFWTGQFAWWVFWRGAKRMIGADLTHSMFLPWIAWTYWQPKWVDFARDAGKSSNE